MKLSILNLSEPEKHKILGLLAGVATCEGTLEWHKIHKETIQAIGYQLMGLDIVAEELPNKFEDAGSFIVEQVQLEILHLGCPLVFLEDTNEKQRVASLEKLAKIWGIKDHVLKEVHRATEGHKGAFLACEFRLSSAVIGIGTLHSTFGYLAAKLHITSGKKLYERYSSYGTLAEGTFGKTLYNYYVENAFALPGSPGSALNDQLIYHDMHHVITGSDTGPLGELCVIAFNSGVTKEDATGILTAVTAQFQIGYTIADPTAETWVGQFDPEVAYRTYKRGLDCTVNYLEKGFDWLPYIDRPLSDVRKEFNISEVGMLVSSPEDKWCGKYGVYGKRKDPNLLKEGYLDKF